MDFLYVSVLRWLSSLLYAFGGEGIFCESVHFFCEAYVFAKKGVMTWRNEVESLQIVATIGET